jgi:transcriptional regulator with XRE-family HTH domain
MEKICVSRLLRGKYNISIKELAAAANVSHQYVSGIELGEYTFGSCETLIHDAFEKIIKHRTEQALGLAEDYAANRDRLLEFITEDGYEL